jgi:hypothetical protein
MLGRIVKQLVTIASSKARCTRPKLLSHISMNVAVKVRAYLGLARAMSQEDNHGSRAEANLALVTLSS